MEIGFDPAKRALTLAERGLDFVDAAQVFDGPERIPASIIPNGGFRPSDY